MLVAIVAVAALLLLAHWRRASTHAIEDRARELRPLGPSGVVVGAEAICLSGGPAAVLLLHGAGDTPQSLRYLAEALHARGFTVHAPLLPGHGTTLRDFAHSSAARWLDGASAAYRALRAEHAWVGIVGQSMGGALAVQIAATSPELPALVLIAPYLVMPLGLRVVGRLAPLWTAVQPYPSATSPGSVLDPAEREKGLGYGYFPPRALRALARAAARAWAALPSVRTPTLVIQSRMDNRISPADAEHAFARLGALEKRLLWVEGAGHVLTVDYGRERLFHVTTEWLRAHGGAPAHGGRSGVLSS